MSVETQATEELYQITLNGSIYTFKLVGKAAAAAFGLMKSILEGDLRHKGSVKMSTLMSKSRTGIASVSLSQDDYEVLKRQMKESRIMYCAVKADVKGSDAVTVFIDREDAHRVNQLISVNELNTIDVTEVVKEVEGNVETEVEQEQHVQNDDSVPLHTAEDIKRGNEDFFSSFEIDEKEGAKTENPNQRAEQSGRSETLLNGASLSETSLADDRKPIRPQVEQMKKEIKSKSEEPISFGGGFNFDEILSDIENSK